MLPADLRSAETEATEALRAALAAEPRGRWTVELRFEGLRLMPLALRCGDRLVQAGVEGRLLFPDAGATALARRDAPALAPRIASFADQLRLQKEGPSEGVVLLVGAGQTEYEEVETLCSAHRGAVVLINPALEDAAVGIGSVARQRRRGFLAGWQSAYALIPRADGALRRAWPDAWQLYRLDPDGYRAVTTFDQKPDGEQLEQALSGQARAGLGTSLRALDQFIEGLRS